MGQAASAAFHSSKPILEWLADAVLESPFQGSLYYISVRRTVHFIGGTDSLQSPASLHPSARKCVNRLVSLYRNRDDRRALVVAHKKFHGGVAVRRAGRDAHVDLQNSRNQ
jgi:hypothetical protein